MLIYMIPREFPKNKIIHIKNIEENKTSSMSGAAARLPEIPTIALNTFIKGGVSKTTTTYNIAFYFSSDAT